MTSKHATNYIGSEKLTGAYGGHFQDRDENYARLIRRLEANDDESSKLQTALTMPAQFEKSHSIIAERFDIGRPVKFITNAVSSEPSRNRFTAPVNATAL